MDLLDGRPGTSREETIVLLAVAGFSDWDGSRTLPDRSGMTPGAVSGALVGESCDFGTPCDAIVDEGAREIDVRSSLKSLSLPCFT